MINYTFKFIESLSIFNTKRVSSSSTNEGYYIGDSIERIDQSPEILWNNICFINQEKLIWTHGNFYCITPVKLSDLVNDTNYITITDVSTKQDVINVSSFTPSSNVTISPNIYYNLGTISSNTTITLAAPTDNTIYNEYMLTFDVSGTPVITLPNNLVWMDGEIPTFENNKTYDISIVNNKAIFGKF